MTKMQKAIIYKGPGTFAYEERPIPEIRHCDDIRIKIYGCAICGTDVNIFATPQKHPCKEDIIFGHEFCGEVEQVGSAVTNLKIGDKVIIDPHGPCGYCDNCLAGLPEACENVFIGADSQFEGQALSMGVFADGGEVRYVELRFVNSLIGAVVDRFGKALTVSRDGEDHFRVTVPAAVSPQFFGWLAGFGEKAQLLSPQNTAQEYKSWLSAALDAMQ